MAKKPAGNKTGNRGKGKPDLNVRAYETMPIATGQVERPTPEPQKKPLGVSLRKHAKKTK
jgi:hypothetical protein